MSATHGFLLLLVVLYLSDCLWWLPLNGVVLESTWLSGGWRIRSAGGDFGNGRRSLFALTPLPFAVAIELEAKPWSVSPLGLLAWSSAAWSSAGRPQQPGWSKTWDEIERIEAVGHTVWIDGLELQRFAIAEDALTAARGLDELRQTAEEKREQAIIEDWRQQLSTDGLVERLDAAAREASTLRKTGAALWFAMFAIVPTFALLLGGPKVLLSLAALLLLLVLINVAIHRNRHSKLFASERWRRNELSVLMCLSWPMAARSADLLIRHRLAEVHPFALALALGDSRGGGAFVERVLRDASFPLAINDLDERGRAIADWEIDHLEPLLWSAAAEAGIAGNRDAGPPREDDAAAYCPRCWDRFVVTGVECSNCPGVSSHPFPNLDP